MCEKFLRRRADAHPDLILRGVRSSRSPEDSSLDEALLSDFSTFCFQASIALLIALLAWGDQIRQPRRAVTEVVQKFLAKIDRTMGEIAPLIRDTYDRATKGLVYSMTDVNRAALRLRDSGLLHADNIEIIGGLQVLFDQRRSLESWYAARYFGTVGLTTLFAIVGFLSIGSPPHLIELGQGVALDPQTIYAGAVAIVSGFIVVNLLISYAKESKFITMQDSIDDRIKVN
jgi:hypothetical protein